VKNKQYILGFCILFASIVNGQSKIKLDFELRNVDGKIISLSNFKSEKGIILTFVSNGCPVSEFYQKRIQHLQNQYAEKGFPVVAINPVDSFEIMKDTASTRQYSYYFLNDSTQSVALAYKVKVNTHTYVLLNTPKGFKIVYDGAIDDDYSGDNILKKYVEEAIELLLNKKSVSTKHTKVLGCPINYRD
jgi:peroxiredoxin